jgi:WD40 repeat protein
MHTLSRSVSPEIASVPPIVSNAGHPVPVQVLEGHDVGVRCVCFYADENKLVSGSGDNTLRIWDRKTGAAQVLSGHTRWVWDVDVSRDGKMVVSGSEDKTVRIWDGESGEVMHVFEGHKDEVNSVEFSRDSSRVVSGSDDHTVRVWLVETGELAFEPIECHGVVRCVRYSPSGDRIASSWGTRASKFGTRKQESGFSPFATHRSGRWRGLRTAHTSSGEVRAKSRSGTRSTEDNYAHGRPTTGGSEDSHSHPMPLTWRLPVGGKKPRSYSIPQRASKSLL